MLMPLASALLTIGGILHVAALVVLALPGRARPVTAGDAAFLIAFGLGYLIAALALAKDRRWGRWLGILVSGLEAIPAAVLLYVLVVFSADPGSSRSFDEIALLALLLGPLVVLAAVWRHQFAPRAADRHDP